MPTPYLIPDTFYGVALLELDDDEAALQAAARARTRYEQRSTLSQLPMAYMIIAGTHYSTGSFDDAFAEIEAGAAVVEDTGNLNFVLYSDSILARISLRRGDLASAQVHLANGTARLATGSLFGAGWLFDSQTQYLAAIGDLDAALAIGEMTWSQTAFLRHFYGHRERGVFLARLAHEHGRDDLAEEATASLEEGTRRTPALSARAAALQCRGIVNSDATMLLDAVACFRQTPLQPALAICCEDAANVLATHERRGEAVSLLSEAAAIHALTGAVGEARRIDTTLRTLGVRPKRPRAGRPTFGWESLTPMEISVSGLVAEGLTNPDIGNRLHVSRRTVETHLAHVFRKLSYASRSQLAAEFTRQSATT